MKRLTKENWQRLDPWECCRQDEYCERTAHGEGGCTGGCIVPVLYAKLGQYEDTGLTPEEIKKTRMETDAGCVKAVAYAYGIDVNRLRVLAEADKEGRVAMLPCGVGDKGMKETTEHRAVEIAAWVLQKMGACTMSTVAEELTCWLDGPDQTCRECIRDWLMDKAEQELCTEKETR